MIINRLDSVPSSTRRCGAFKLGARGSQAARRSSRSRSGTVARAQQSNGRPLIKICGVTNPEDAELAAKAGADFVGMIMWQKARRAVSISTAASIADAARSHGAEPVGVFVDEDFADIVNACKSSNVRVAQLHGKRARGSLHDLPNWLQVIYVLHASPDGTIQTKDLHTPLGNGNGSRQADWLLIDGLKGGSGETYDWKRLQPPALNQGMKGWLLAGGLTPDNVGEAVALANPIGVDVSSGVTLPDGLRKDPDKVLKFVEQVQQAAGRLEGSVR